MGLPAGVTGEDLATDLDRRGIRVLDLRSCSVGLRRRRAGDLPREGIVFGYGNLPDAEVDPVVTEIGTAIRSLRA
jgi:hypothetical protein